MCEINYFQHFILIHPESFDDKKHTAYAGEVEAKEKVEEGTPLEFIQSQKFSHKCDTTKDNETMKDSTCSLIHNLIKITNHNFILSS